MLPSKLNKLPLQSICPGPERNKRNKHVLRQRKARTAKIKILGVGSQDDETFLLCKVPFGFALGLAPQLPRRYYILRTIQRHGLVNSDAWSLALRMVRHPQNSPDSLLFLAKDQNSSQWFKSHALSSPFSCTKGLAVISGAYWLD